MMAAGKTTLGKIVAQRQNMKFVDTDSIIENKNSMSISEIFEKKGEKFFREFEEKITLKVLKKKETIVSLGGGAFMNKKIREEIRKNHFSFWLKWDPKTLIKRIQNNTKRPIAIKSSTSELLDLIKKRSKVYSRSKYKINCEQLSKNEIVNKIIDVYENNKIVNKN